MGFREYFCQESIRSNSDIQRPEATSLHFSIEMFIMSEYHFTWIKLARITRRYSCGKSEHVKCIQNKRNMMEVCQFDFNRLFGGNVADINL